MRSWLWLIVCGLFCCTTLPGMEFRFVRGGQAACTIMLPVEPSEFEKRAAEDLQSFLKQMSGAEIKICPEGTQSKLPAIYIGQTRFAASKGADHQKLGKEEYQIIPAGRDLAVTGGRPIGSFYGVWRLLNRLGVWSLSMEQDVVPQRKDAALDIKAEKHAPTFSSRIIYDGLPIHYKAVKISPYWQNRYGLWLLRNGINGRQHHLYSPPYVGEMSDIPHSPLHHTFSLYVPRWYFSKHPEYFAMDSKGVRRKPENDLARGGLCLSNPEVAKLALDSLRKMIKKHRAERPREKWAVLYDISPLDLAQVCCCPECRAIAEEEGGDPGVLFRFINYVAENIRKEYPDIIIRTTAYGKFSGLPKKTRLADNVILQLADKFVTGDCFKPLSHPFNAPSRKMFEMWAKQKYRLTLWDYWNMAGYCNPPRMEVIFDTIAPDFRYLRKCGVTGMFIEAEKHEFKPQNFLDLEYFVASQLMLDLDQDPEQLADIFLKGYYGAAAPEMKKLFNQLREGVKKYPELQPGMRTKIWDYMTPEWMWNTWTLLEKAAAKVPAGSRYQRRVHDETLSLLWMILQQRGSCLKYFQSKGMSREKLFEVCRARSLAHLKRYDAARLNYNYQYARTQYHCEMELNRLNLTPLPVPPKFADVDPVNRRVFGIYQYQPLQEYNTFVVDDPDSPTGKALMATDDDPAKHGAETVVRDPKGKWAFRATQFGLCGKGITIDPVAQDEKYHWYKIPEVTLKPKYCWFWGYIWHLQIVLDAAYQIDDGASKENLWDCWFSVKFTGPAYVPGSKKKNAVWVDTVVLTRPGETKIRRR